MDIYTEMVVPLYDPSQKPYIEEVYANDYLSEQLRGSESIPSYV